MSRLLTPPRGQILIGDALTELRRLPSESVDSVVTSPPYFKLRDYQVGGQIGLEASVDDWVDGLQAVAREARRVLVPTGTFWLNLGDSYATKPSDGAPRKSLLLGPERLGLRLVADGWVLRNTITWAKKNPVPTSVKDRLNATHELIYVFAKQPLYFFDLDAIRVPHTSAAPKRHRQVEGQPEAWRGPNANTVGGLKRIKNEGRVGHPLGKNPGDVWIISSSGYRSAGQAEHHATFPLELATRMIAAGTPEARCRRCKQPWRRPVIRSLGSLAVRGHLAPICTCDEASQPGLVVDPFMGSGTTAVAAEALGRDWLGIELNPDFARLAHDRIQTSRSAAAKPSKAA